MTSVPFRLSVAISMIRYVERRLSPGVNQSSEGFFAFGFCRFLASGLHGDGRLIGRKLDGVSLRLRNAAAQSEQLQPHANGKQRATSDLYSRSCEASSALDKSLDGKPVVLAAKNMNVLVVDDQESMRSLAKLALKMLGITKVVDVADARTAFAKLHETAVDLVICDWIMADMDGLALVSQMRAHPVLKSTPFIMASARQNPEQIAAAMKAGVTGYLVKPFKPEDLKAGIEKACGALQ